MFLDYLHISAAGLAVFLIGANLAFMIHLGESIRSWFQFKILAIMMLLIYVVTSLVLDSPGLGNSIFAFIALMIDAVAVYRLWANVMVILSGRVEVVNSPKY